MGWSQPRKIQKLVQMSIPSHLSWACKQGCRYDFDNPLLNYVGPINWPNNTQLCIYIFLKAWLHKSFVEDISNASVNKISWVHLKRNSSGNGPRLSTNKYLVQMYMENGSKTRKHSLICFLSNFHIIRHILRSQLNVFSIFF